MRKKISIKEMINLLNDRTVDPGGRDDMISCLAEEGDQTALNVLYDIASNPKSEDDVSLIGECGEAIGKIMCRTGYFNIDYINGLLPYKWGSALHNAIEIIKECRPDWYKEHKLEDLEKKQLISKINIK